MKLETHIFLLWIMITFVAAFAISSVALADGPVYKGGKKPFECINPTLLEDGQPIDPADIESVTMYVTDSSIFSSTLLSIPMPGGCTRIEDYDISSIGYGQFYTSARIKLKGGEESVYADGLPFMSKSSANPLPPVVVE